MADMNELPGPVEAHKCAESEHHREEANKLRELLQRIDASNDRLAEQNATLRAQLAAVHSRITAMSVKPGLPREVWAELCVLDSEMSAMGIGRVKERA